MRAIAGTVKRAFGVLAVLHVAAVLTEFNQLVTHHGDDLHAEVGAGAEEFV